MHCLHRFKMVVSVLALSLIFPGAFNLSLADGVSGADRFKAAPLARERAAPVSERPMPDIASAKKANTDIQFCYLAASHSFAPILVTDLPQAFAGPALPSLTRTWQVSFSVSSNQKEKIVAQGISSRTSMYGQVTRNKFATLGDETKFNDVAFASWCATIHRIRMKNDVA